MRGLLGRAGGAGGDDAAAIRSALTALVRRFKDPLLKKIVRRSKKYHAHDENRTAKVGDIVKIRECRPVSKLKKWEVFTDEA